MIMYPPEYIPQQLERLKCSSSHSFHTFLIYYFWKCFVIFFFVDVFTNPITILI